MKLLTITLLMLLSFNLSAGEANLLVGGWSKHFDNDYDYNESHDLVAVEIDNIIIGKFKNSYYDETLVVAYRFTLKEFGDFNFGGYLGADYGYKSCGYGSVQRDPQVCFRIIPELVYTKHRFQPALLVMGTNSIGFALKVKFETH